MLEAILLASLFFCGTKATYDDMSDEDFTTFVKAHDVRPFVAEYGNAFGGGCVKGGVTGALTGAGWQALCIGCAVGGTSEVAREVLFPREKKDN